MTAETKRYLCGCFRFTFWGGWCWWSFRERESSPFKTTVAISGKTPCSPATYLHVFLSTGVGEWSIERFMKWYGPQNAEGLWMAEARRLDEVIRRMGGWHEDNGRAGA